MGLAVVSIQFFVIASISLFLLQCVLLLVTLGSYGNDYILLFSLYCVPLLMFIVAVSNTYINIGHLSTQEELKLRKFVFTAIFVLCLSSV